jgi:hypothetical protein
LFAWVSYALYREIRKQPDLEHSLAVIKASFSGPNQWKLILACLLMFVNWGIEARKWQVLVRSLQDISFTKAFKAVFSGQSLAVNTPNRVGEYVGRVVYLEEGNRLRGIALTIVGSLSQTIITLLAGLAGMFFMKDTITGALKHILMEVGFLKRFPELPPVAYDLVFYSVLIGVLVMLVIYFELSYLTRLLERLPFVNKYSYLIEKLEDFHWKELTRILSLSVSRYIVFVVQFILLLQFCNVDVPFWEAAGMVSVFYLVLAVVPTISTIELSLRGLAAVELFGILSNNTFGIIAAAGGIWFINLIIPALAGSLFILGIKLFKSKREKDS